MTSIFRAAGRLFSRSGIRGAHAAPCSQNTSFDAESVYKGHHRITYMGVKALKCPFDYVIYQMILCDLRPDLVIEIGTNDGGGALYIADLMDIIGHGTVHTIDVKEQSDERVHKHSRIEFFTDGWENYDLRAAEQHESVLVIEDASHIYEDTLLAMRKFAPVVTRGSYLIVEDGIISYLGMEDDYRGGPLKAIREFLAENGDFEVDRAWCDMFGKNATFNVEGYLRRKT